MTILEEAAKRQKALEMQAEYEKRYGPPPGVTYAGEYDPIGVIQPVKPLKTAAGGRAGRGGSPRKGAKNRGSSAAARAPEAAARPMAKTNPDRRENEFMLNTMIVRNTLMTNAPAIRERARRAGKWVWRDIRLMLTLINRIQDALIETMPESRDQYYTAYARHGHYKMEIDGPIDTARHVLITARHLGAITDAAMSSECILCIREGNEISRCPLRDALLEVAPPTNLEPEGMIRKCEYRDAAGKILHGEEVKEI